MNPSQSKPGTNRPAFSPTAEALIDALDEAGVPALTPLQARLAADALVAHLEDRDLVLVTTPPPGPNRGQVERLVGGPS